MARANAFVDYSETDKPGLYQFKDGSGGSRLLWGTAAEEIKTGIDKGRASVAGALGAGKLSPDEWNAMGTPAAPPAPLPDERTAAVELPDSMRYKGPGATAGGTLPGTESKADVQPSMVKPVAAPKGEPVPELTPEQMLKYRMRAPEQARSERDAKATAAGPVKPQYDLQSVDPKTGKEVYVRRGSDGTNPADIEIRYAAQQGSAGRPGGWRDMSATVQGGHALDEDLMGQQQMSSGVREVAIEENLATNEEENRLVQQEITRQSDLAARLADEERRRQDDVQRFTDHAKSEFEKYTAQVNSAQINPDRIYSGEGGKARETRHRIASIFGAFGSTLAKSPNFVAERLARMKADDIAAQEKDLLKLQGQRDTALKYFRDLTGDLDAAKQAVIAVQSQQNILALKKIEALAKTPRDKTAAKVAIANEQEAYEVAREAYMRSAAGTRSVSAQNLMPVAGTPGRAEVRRAPTAEERKDVVANQAAGRATGDVQKDITGRWAKNNVMREIAGKYPADYVAETHENKNLGSRIAGSALDLVAGAGTTSRTFNSPVEAKGAHDFLLVQKYVQDQLSVRGGQGAASETDAPKLAAAAAPNATMGDLQAAVEIFAAQDEAEARAAGVSVGELIQQNRAPSQ